MADLMSNMPSKEAMLGIAEDYERLAKWSKNAQSARHKAPRHVLTISQKSCAR